VEQAPRNLENKYIRGHLLGQRGKKNNSLEGQGLVHYREKNVAWFLVDVCKGQERREKKKKTSGPNFSTPQVRKKKEVGGITPENKRLVGTRRA